MTIDKLYDDLKKSEMQFRELLWLRCNDGSAYGDDGEMQLWGIDFKRQPVDEIEEALYWIGIKKLYGSEARLEERGTPNPVLESSNLSTPAK